MAETRSAPSVFSNRYGLWLGGIGVSLFGSAIFSFGLGWVATGQGGTLAGVVNSVRLLPGLVLVLIGGAWADRYGPWRVMVLSDAAMTAVGICAGFLFHLHGVTAWLLIAVAVCAGTANSMYIPASAVVPRVLVPPSQLGRAMAARTVVGQVANLLAPSLGGIAVVALGIASLSWFNAASFFVIFVVLLASRRQLGRPETAPAESRKSANVIRQSWDGLVHCVRDPVLRTLILAVGVVAAVVLPLSSILIPLLARSRDWSARAAGAIAAAQVLGGMGVSLLVVWRGSWRRPGRASALGLGLAGCGCIGLAFAPTPAWAVTAGAMIGLGIGIFTSHVSPVVLQATATTHLARVQSVLLMVQMAPVVLTANLIGIVADRMGAPVVAAGCGGVVLATALGFYLNPAANRTTAGEDVPAERARG